MDIPEVSEHDVKLMKQVCFDPNMSVFSQCSLKSEDPLEEATEAARAAVSAKHLASLGFLKEITAEHQERINTMNENSGRVWSVFEITAMGRAFFQLQGSSLVH